VSAQAPGNPLTEGPLLSAILRLSWPMMLGNFLQSSSSIFDMIFVGRLGPDAIAGVSMSGAIIQFALTLVIGVDMGMRAMVSRFYGARDLAMTRRVIGQSLLMAAVLSLLLAGAGEVWRDDLLRLLGASPGVVDQGSAYLSIFFLGIAASVSIFFTSGILQSIGDAHTPMRLGAIAFGANIMLAATAAYFLGARTIIGIFTQDTRTLSIGVKCLQIFSAGFLFMALNLILGRALQGAGDTLSPLVFALVSRLPLLMGLLHTLPHIGGLGTDGLWYSFVVASGVEGLLKLYWFQRGKWKLRRV
jgi:Na+-driven multidrug efflux pump